MSSERVAFAKVRSRIRREIAEIEESEHEGGELNLVPFLDIVTNTVIFLLATTASVIAMANINVNAPRYAEPASAASGTPDPPQKALNLTVTTSYKGFIIAGSGAVLRGPGGKLPTVGCSVALKSGRCPCYLGSRLNQSGEPEPIWVDKYNYKGLIKKLEKIKKQYPLERQAILMADRGVPYNAVVRTMDALRGKPTAKCTGRDGCLFDKVILSAGLQ